MFWNRHIIKLDWSVYTCLTQLYDGRDMYKIYYIKNYMFRHFSLAILRLINEKKNLVSCYTRLVCVVYSGEVRGEVGTRSCMCCVGWVVWVQGFCYFCYSRYMYTWLINIQCATLHKCSIYSYSRLIDLRLYTI